MFNLLQKFRGYIERGLSDIQTYKQQKFYCLFYMHLQSGGGGCVGVCVLHKADSLVTGIRFCLNL